MYSAKYWVMTRFVAQTMADAKKASAASTDAPTPSAAKCMAAGCGKPAAQKCPRCDELKLPTSYFCSQECFKKSWGEHNQVHKGSSFLYRASFCDCC
jgi:hypothetical protein